jgi:5-formyltetrahydrofolate cyclo-ligase
MPDIQDAKRQLRQTVAQLKESYSAETLSMLSEKILKRLEQNPLFRQAKGIALYHALPGEVQTAACIEKWRTKKKIFLPVVDGDQLHLYRYTGKDTLKKNAFDIWEPDTSLLQTTSTEDIDLIIVPGIAFDRQRNRMGRGKGYYDRLLASSTAPCIGICFQFQLFEHVPADAHDRKMTLIITEQEIIA